MTAAAQQLPLETPWWQRRLTAFDIETTGPKPEEARIVSVCIVHVGGGRRTVQRTWLVNPGVEIPAEAAAIHGITTERARAEGIDPVRALTEIARELGDAVDAGLPLVICNAPFDLTVLDREMQRHQVEVPIGPARVIDPLVLDKEHDRFRKGSRKLEALCAHYKARLDGAHDAAFDAIAAARVAYRIGQTFPQLGAMSLDALHEAQRRWYRAERLRFADYRREQGKPIDDEQRDWPLTPRSAT